MISNPYHYNPVNVVGTRPVSQRTTFGDLLRLLVFVEHLGLMRSRELSTSTLSALNSIDLMLQNLPEWVELPERTESDYVTAIRASDDRADTIRRLNGFVGNIVWDAAISQVQSLEDWENGNSGAAVHLFIVWNQLQIDAWRTRLYEVEQELHAHKNQDLSKDPVELEEQLAVLVKHYARVTGDDLQVVQDSFNFVVSEALDEYVPEFTARLLN